VRKAEEGSAFCRRHGEAIFGAMLGALTYADPVAEPEPVSGEDKGCRSRLPEDSSARILGLETEP